MHPLPVDFPAPVGFDFQPRTRIIFGPKSVEGLGQWAGELAARKILIVTDRGIVSAGHAGRVMRLLESAGMKVTIFDDVEENPSTTCVEKCVGEAHRSGVDTIIGLGGGSSMDTAKGCNFLLTNGGRMQDYWGVGKAALPMLPLIAIPTTGGTGSECQSFALITDPATHQKMACGDPKAAARLAILDPELTISQPPRVTACAGIDAIAHAVETAVTKRCTPLSALFSREAFRLTMTAFPRVLEAPDDLEARGSMQLGAAWAGLAIENSMLGAAHSAANPLTANFGIAHGQAVGLMLPHIVRFNSADPATARAYADLAQAAQFASSTETPETTATDLADRLEQLLTLAGIARPLSAWGARETDLPRLAHQAAAQWTAQFNPRTIGVADFERIFAAAMR